MKKKVLKNVIISLMFVVIICANIAVVSGMPSNKGILLLHVFHPLIGTNSEDTDYQIVEDAIVTARNLDHNNETYIVSFNQLEQCYTKQLPPGFYEVTVIYEHNDVHTKRTEIIPGLYTTLVFLV